ncbi:MAG: tRNA uridine-5-carboxymethylaminomethyl(34) synthesis enzyme MnmG, partial [Chloroflexi bacterium]|nr:tRNA uridine-5-carboxymethylaminomethyl(34) synthesis enzyme MnmG [Chloroflexota bacterium]
VQLNERLAALGIAPVHRSMTAVEFLRRQEVSYSAIRELIPSPEALDEAAAVQVEIEAKYSAYVDKQRRQVERLSRFEQRRLPDDLDYDGVVGLRNEAREKLKSLQPMTVGQASRMAGVTPADISILLVHLEKRRRAAPIATEGL